MINSYIFINILTISRILFAAIIYYLLSNDGNYILALILFLPQDCLIILMDTYQESIKRPLNLVKFLIQWQMILLIFIFFGLAINLSSYLIGLWVL